MAHHPRFDRWAQDKSERGIIQGFRKNLEYVDKRDRKISLMPSAGIRSSGKDVDVKVQIASEFESLNPDWIRFPNSGPT